MSLIKVSGGIRPLHEDLRKRAGRMGKEVGFCVALFCSDSKQPYILTCSELSEIEEFCGKEASFNLTVGVERRTFKVVATSDNGRSRYEKSISKKVSGKKLLH